MNQLTVSERYILLKQAVNAYHKSVGHHCPYYDFNSVESESCPAQVSCCFFPGVEWHLQNKCLYICDAKVFNNLQEALEKLNVYVDQGVAWPNVQLFFEHPTVEWWIFPNQSNLSLQLSWSSSTKFWFLIPEASQSIVDYVARILNLQAVTTGTSLLKVHAAMPQGLLRSTQLPLHLTTIIVHPGDLLASFSVSRDSVCIAVRSSFPIPHIQLDSDGGECEYHSISEVPSFLKFAFDYSKQCTMSGSEIMKAFHSEICVKDEFTSAAGVTKTESEDLTINNTSILRSTADVMSESLQQMNQSLEETQVNQVKRVHVKRRSRSVELFLCRLHCPKCPVVFRYGLHGLGLGCLLRHVYTCHPRLTSYCRSIIKEKYAAVVKNYSKFGKGCLFP